METAQTLNDQGVALMRQGRLDEALAAWQQSLRLGDMPEVHSNIGYLHAARAEWDQAIACYRRALELRPQYPEAINNLGIAHYHQQRVDDAIACFQAALALRPAYAEAHNNLGNALLALGKAVEAGNCYCEVLRLQPNSAEAYNHLGVVFKDLQQWQKAESCWQRSIALNPHDATAQRNLANYYYLRGQTADALAAYRRVLTLRPDDAEVQYAVDVLGGTRQPARAPATYVANLYDSYASGFEQDLVERLHYRGPEHLKAVLGPAPPPHSLAVLDLGCGTGLCGAAFRDWAHTLVGVDLSAGMLARAHGRAIYDELIHGDILTPLDGNDGKFDLVLAGDVLIYLGDLQPLQEIVKRALRPGGRFAFTVELFEGEGYRVHPTGRFAHSVAYINEVAALTKLQVLAATPIVIRTEQDADVAGLAVVLRRGSVVIHGSMPC